MAQRGCPEIVVVGAGPVGLLFASVLVRGARTSELRIRVVDAQAAIAWDPDQVDPRVYALSRESQLYLGSRWEQISASRVSPYRRMRVWEGESPATGRAIDFDCADIGEPDLGHIVEDSLLRRVLLDDLATTDVEISLGRGVESLARRDDVMAVTFDDGTSISADLVVGADGVNSKVRAAAGIDSIRKSYGQRAIVTHVTTSQPHAETAWQRFLPDGPLAFLPLADGRSSVVWSTAEHEAERLLHCDDAAFLGELESASGGILGRLGPCTKRYAFRLGFAHAIRYSLPHVVLIGDAAHSVHPLAGQGMNLGLRDAATLARTLCAAIGRGEYPGDQRVLRRYDRAQKAHNIAMQLAFDAINQFFGWRLPEWAMAVRGMGLGIVNRSDPVKRLLMRRALGLDRTGTWGDAA